MKKKKIHFLVNKKPDKAGGFWDIPCSVKYVWTNKNMSAILDDVTCESCKLTKAYLEAKQKLEKDRPFEKGEFEEPKKEILDYKFITTIEATKEEHAKYLDYCCDIIQHYKSEFIKDDKRRYSFVYLSDRVEFQNFVANLDSEEKWVKPQTVKTIDSHREKYNLNDEQTKILENVDYELKEFKFGKFNPCNDCLFDSIKKDCHYTLPCTNEKNKKTFYFKQIHKTQSSLNEAIEKDSLEDGIEEPFKTTNYKINAKMEYIGDDITKDVVGMFSTPNKETKEPHVWDDNTEPNEQQSSHYQNGVETIEKIEMILSNLDDKITPFQGYLLGNVLKYSDRLGLKDDKSKDAYKASDYASKLLNENWIHEK